MRLLVGWENQEELETIESFLSVGGRHVAAFAEERTFQQAFEHEAFDAVLLSLDFPSQGSAFPLFQRFQRVHPETPVVGAWFPGEISHVARFVRAGLFSYVFRDPLGEFIMLLSTTLDSACQAVTMRRAARLADKLREEIDAIRRLQQTLLPASMPHLPGYRLAARYEPSQIRILGEQPVVLAGGDYYNAYPQGNDSVGLVLGDSAGHGVNACLSMLTMHSLLSSIRGVHYPSTAQFVADVNHRLCHSSVFAGERGSFITMLYCHLDLQDHVLEWTSAGHPLPLLHDLSTNQVRPLGGPHQSGIPLVISEQWPYTSWKAALPRHSRLLLYTDGLEEAFPQDGSPHQQFGISGIVAAMQRQAKAPLEGVLDELFDASHRATNGDGRIDDTSVVLLERTA